MDEFKIPVATSKAQTSSKSSTIPTASIGASNLAKSTVTKVLGKPEAHPDVKCSYKEPKWSAPPNEELHYKFEVLKSGTIVEEIDNLQNKPFWVFGRLAGNDIVMAHPTISRFHAVLQYKPPERPAEEDEENETKDNRFGEGWYLYDLASTHGTFLNKMRIPPRTYIPIRVGHMITLGSSTRKFILQGPEFDEEPESELTVTELKEKRVMEEEERQRQEELQEELREKEGISWGLAEDADEETDLSVNPYASTNNEELFLDDPKKTLRGFFEREGLDLEYNVDEMSLGTFVCRVELPLDDANGRPIVAEVCHKGKKKECVLQCALEACRILDRHGVLRQSHHEPMKRRAPTTDSDDDDDFLDRTGDVERKKLRKANAGQSTTLTYDDLVKQESELSEQIAAIKNKILRHQEKSKQSKEKEAAEVDDLDDFMKNLSYDKDLDKTEIRKLRMEELRLQLEYQKLQRLIKIAKPTELPALKTTNEDSGKKKPLLPLFGKRNKTKFQFSTQSIPTKKTETKELRSDEEEVEEDEPEKTDVESEIIATTTSDVPVNARVKNENQSNSTGDEKGVSGENAKSGEISQEKFDQKPIKGPAFIPPKLLHNEERTPSPDSHNSIEIDDVSNTEDTTDEPSIDETMDKEEDSKNLDEAGSTNKKRRNRNRVRTKGRENVDMDDKEELKDGNKYSGWIPPQNQTGDGMTQLNEKFGY